MPADSRSPGAFRKGWDRWMSWLWTGRRVPHRLVRVANLPLYNFALTAIAVVLGVWSSLFSRTIVDATGAFATGHWENGAHPLVGAFWSVMLIWSVAFYVRMVVEVDERRRYFAVAYRAPNPFIFDKYDDTYRKVVKMLAALDKGLPDLASQDDRHAAYEDTLRSALQVIADFTRTFARAHDSTRYTANLMFAIRPDQANSEVQDALRFFPGKHYRLDQLKALLILPARLWVDTSKGPVGLAKSSTPDPARDAATDMPPEAPLLALAVPVPPRDAHDVVPLLPGAPEALLGGGMSVQRDTSVLGSEHCSAHAKGIRDEVTTYFSKDGAGRQIRSFVSIRMGPAEAPIGALNIDCDTRDVLGPEPEHFSTFLALITPLVQVLEPAARAYARGIPLSFSE